ncbi:transcription elongation factor B polypeptide 3-like [Homalodisca vitripennis]|uniref:transcription elongation factor B polypeptide 3-like n=1 Tax=Homalodisca vitripennis TaxID=197043 RepID=UPI001EE9EE83|nr:transcription elongation factor B polypeptide 3-like [Homalodisca vitripennis]
MSDKSILDQIKHYQRDIIKSPDDSKRMLRCIERLTVLPVTIGHLQETGVGRSVNELRKCGGEVGAAASALVAKWKNMVVKEEENEEEESASESDAETNESKDHHSPPRGVEIDKKLKPVSNNEDYKKIVSSQSSNKKHESSRSDSRSSRSSDHRTSIKSDHKSHRSDSVKSSGSASDSKHSSSHKSKIEYDSRSHKKPHSSHKSESEVNGKVTKEKSHSKEKTDNVKHSKSSSVSSCSDSKNVDTKLKYSKDKHRTEDHSSRNTSSNSIPSTSKKYDLKKIDSDTSDDENVYKPSNKKRKKSDSEEEEKYSSKYSKKPFNNEFLKKRKHDSSEESVESDSDEDTHVNGGSVKLDSHNSESEMSNRSAEDNPSDNEVNDDRSSSQGTDHERSPSERNSDSGGSEEVSEPEEYVPVKIKREKESPPKYSKSSDSEKRKSSSGKNSHSSSNVKNYSPSSLVIKKEKDFEDVKIKKEKIDKDNVKPQKQKEEKTSSDKRSHKSSSSHSGSSSKNDSKTDKKAKVKIEKKEDGSIDCESGASFGDALLGLSETKKKPVKRKPTTPSQERSPKPVDRSLSKPKTSSRSDYRPSSTGGSSSSSKSLVKEPDLLSKNIKLEPLDVDLKSTLPEITPHYKPLPHYSPPSSPVTKRSKLWTEEEALSTIMATKNQRTKVYSGNKTGYTKVPSLFDLCIQVLRDNIEALEYTGGVPYDLLKPVLDRATADQLYQLEHYNSYLIGDTDGLWEFHCNKDFRGKKPDEYETWRELYLRLLDEREKKLEALKANISQSMAKSTPIRQTKLAYVDSVVKPPRNVARKQMKFGTQKAVKHELVSKAMVGAAGASSSSPAPDVVPVPSPGPSRSRSDFPIPNFLKKKKAPLMAKALQLIKGNRFKR